MYLTIVTLSHTVIIHTYRKEKWPWIDDVVLIVILCIQLKPSLTEPWKKVWLIQHFHDLLPTQWFYSTDIVRDEHKPEKYGSVHDSWQTHKPNYMNQFSLGSSWHSKTVSWCAMPNSQGISSWCSSTYLTCLVRIEFMELHPTQRRCDVPRNVFSGKDRNKFRSV